jgi:hypothetical protein
VARRQSAASRSSASSSRPGAGRSAGPRARTDGRVDVSCPQCAAAYRIGEELLDTKIECTECHRVFFAKTTAGKKTKPPDYTKVYVGFGVGIVAIIGIFIVMSSGGEKPKPKPTVSAPKTPAFTLGTHPRAMQLVKWAQSIGDNNQLVTSTHSDLSALAAKLEVPDAESAAVIAALQTHDSTRYLRELQCESAALSSESDMTALQGSGIVYVTPKPGDDNYLKNTRGELVVTFQMAGDQVKVTGFDVKMKPIWNPAKPDPHRKGVIQVYKDINAPDEVEITDSAGTRKVQESDPSALPHWDKATPEQRAKVDQIVADILESASHDADARLFNRATMQIRTKEDKQAAVPRVLNAMHDLYQDVNANNMKLSQLNRALGQWTGYAVNYEVSEHSTDAATAKKRRESCIRQWFAFWWRYHGDLSKFFDTSDNLEESLDEPDKKKGE